MDQLEHRRHPRLRLDPACTSVVVQAIEDDRVQTMHGHAYDVSESGVRIELDEALRPGQHVGMCLQLPTEAGGVFVSGRIMWVFDDQDDPGPRRMAVQFTRFLHDEDRHRLLRYLQTSLPRFAA